MGYYFLDTQYVAHEEAMICGEKKQYLDIFLKRNEYNMNEYNI